MPKNGLLTPLAILALGLLLTVSVLARTDGTAPVTRMQSADYPYPSPGTTTTGATATSQTATVTPAVTSTARAQVTPSATVASTAIATVPAQVQAPTLPPTPTPTEELAGTVACVPGTPLLVSGRGPAFAPVLLYFGDRIVGGSSIGADGTFALPLDVGMERAGVYPVSVRVRGSGVVLVEFVCSVPQVTPTPIPSRSALP